MKRKKIKLFKKREKKHTQKNNKLCKVITTKEAEALSMMEVKEDHDRVEQENKTLYKKLQEVEKL